MAKTVAIVGRPNVGKSTLFNRLAGRKLALVHDMPGVTRDRREAEGALGDLRFTLIDTAGFEAGREESLARRTRAQTETALSGADLVILLVDARAGVMADDRDFARALRRLKKPVLLVANKAERGAPPLDEFFALGLGTPIAISAEHGEGMAELYAALAPALAPEPAEAASAEDAPEKPLKLAIIGRPNVGKSTLVNRLLGAERMLTGPEAGITRDAIAIPWEWQGRAVSVIDTAGLRRRAKVAETIEQMAVADAFSAIRFAELCVLVTDATQLLEKQDLTIAREVAEEGRALVLAVNKWDLVADKRAKRTELKEKLESHLPQLSGLETVMLSAKTGAGIDTLMPAVLRAYAAWNRRVATPLLNRWLAEAQDRNPPPLVSGRRLRLRYIAQANIRPPTFALFASKPGDLPESYRRYLVNLLRQSFDLPGVPIRMMLRKGKNPYDTKGG
ncbi:MAG TPA: ribosome biogenesis GTPase Der [Stellaceae bacterium]|nr:ribosome biogenesis GTPase Der [Stellaceae bacterium]